MAWRWQNTSRPKGRYPSYYANNKQYTGAYAQTDVPGRTSRRIHDGFSIQMNYGLDTTSDDLNSSPYSSPYYVNGRYNSDNLTTQRGNSASVQGIQRLCDYYTEKPTKDAIEAEIQTTIEMWQGKQIKFELPYDGRVVGNSIELRNTEGCTGILSIYISTSENGVPIYETSIDLCEISEDNFEYRELYSALTVPARANPKKMLYVRMEIWDEIETDPEKRDGNPFNTGKKIEIAATGKGNHYACVYKLQNKNEPVNETYEYKRFPSRPVMGLFYNNWTTVPVDRIDNIKTGATVSLNGYRYDIFCAKKDGVAEVLVYDKEMNKIIRGPANAPLNIKVDGNVEQLNIAQVTDTDRNTWVYYVDGYSPLQRFKIGEWKTDTNFVTVGSADNAKVEVDEAIWDASALGAESGTYIFKYDNNSWNYNESAVSLSTYGITLTGVTPATGSLINVLYTVTEGGMKTVESIEFVDARPVIGASMIMFHNNRLFLTGFRNDPNLVQISAIEAEGPNYTQFPYRFYAPNRSPYDTSLNPITAIVEIANDQIMIAMKNGFSIYQTYGSKSSSGLEDTMPTQVSIFTDSAGVRSQGDIVNYKGTVYSFDEKEGIRRFMGSNWNDVPAFVSVSSLLDRVDMTKPRKMWGFSNKLYFNYTDKIDGKYKCLIWDQQMNYQQYPTFQDVDIPFCDVRFDETEDLVGAHPDYPCIMKLYAEDTWRRLDSPIVFRRDTKFLSLPGNAADIIVKRVHAKVLANANRWWWMSVVGDKQLLTQERGKDNIFRQPSWDTLIKTEAPELPFPIEDVFERDAVYRLSLISFRIECESVQVRMKTKTFRNQANLLSVLVECQPKNYL
jgi:hypothetical protein